ncbi:MAG: PfkB family carbohydrate kinase [Rhodothermales bacterium]
MSVLAVGTVAFDRIQTPFGQRDRVLGGSAMYITMAARFMCPSPRLVAVVGNDFPDEYMQVMRSNGVDLEGLEVQADGKTFAWGGRYHYDLNTRDTLYTDLNVLSTFRPNVPSAYLDSRILCLGNLDPTVQASVLDQVPDADLVICDTMNFWIDHTPEALKDLLRRIDCLVINDSEARELSGEPNLIRSARLIREMGPHIVVIKKGEHGALLFVDDTVFAVPAYPLEDIQDPTGAGDAFMGGFSGYLSTCGPIDESALKNALVYGSAVASFCVEAFGPDRLATLTADELSYRIHEFRSLTSIPAVTLAT